MRFLLKHSDRFCKSNAVFGIPAENFDAAEIPLRNPVHQQIARLLTRPAEHKGLSKQLFIGHCIHDSICKLIGRNGIVKVGYGF